MESRLQSIRNSIDSNKELKEFDPEIFNAVVSRVIVGSVDENGDADPYTLCFVFVDEKRATCRYNIPSKNTNHVETVVLLSRE